MNNLQSYKADFAIHPGKTLLENLEYLNISQAELSERAGITGKHISNIINAKASITPETAIKLEKVLGIKASFWNALEGNYQATLAQIKVNSDLDLELEQLSDFKETYSELTKNDILIKRRWVSSNFKEILFNLQSFFGVDSLKYVRTSNLQAVYRKYKRKTNEDTVAAWLRLGQIKAQQTEVSIFDSKKLEKKLEFIKQLSLKEIDDYLPELENVLAECGVVLVYAPYLKNTFIQGASQWISKDKAMIMIKTTKQGEDKFWFNLFHEIGHLLKHGKSKTFIDLEDNVESTEEVEADKFAQEKLLSKFDKNEINNYSNVNIAIKKIAKNYNVSESIVAGRLSHEYKDFPLIYRTVSPFIKKMDKINI